MQYHAVINGYPVSAHYDDILYARCKQCVENSVDYALAVYANERFGRVERYGNKAGAEARSYDYGTLYSIRLKRIESARADRAAVDKPCIAELVQSFIYTSERVARLFL